MVLKFNIAQKRISREGNEAIVSGNGDYVFAFSFDGEWDGRIKTARISNGGKYVDIVLNKDGEAKVPCGIIYPPSITVGVYAAGLRTSTAIEVRCEPGVIDGEGELLLPEDGVYTQLTQLCEAAVSECEKSTAACRELSERYDESKISTEELTKYSNAYYRRAFGKRVAPSGGVFPCKPTKLIVFGSGSGTASVIDSVTAGDVEYPLEREVVLRSLGGVCDTYDAVSGKLMRRISSGEVICDGGSLYHADGVYGRSTRTFNIVSHGDGQYKNTECVKVNKRSFSKISVTGCFASPDFVTTPDARDPEKAVAGMMYGGSDDYVYFTVGEAGCDGVSEFKSFCVSKYESGEGLKIYYEYTQPVEEECACSLGELRSESDVISCSGNDIEVEYRADVNLVSPLYGKKVFCFSCCPDSWARAAAISAGAEYEEFLTDGNGYADVSARRSYTERVIKGDVDGDTILFDDGICDYVNSAVLGEMSDSYGTDNDISTSAGGLEEFLYMLVMKYPEKRLCMAFISLPAAERSERRELFKRILEKWGVEYIDFAPLLPPINEIDELKEKYTPDGLYPNEACIKAFYTDRLAQRLRTL